jgi:phage terminase large subunit-like protein
MASFDSMLGLELQGDWLHFYEPSEIPPNEELNLYMGVDPAVSLSDDADRFSMALIGVTKDNSQVYLIEQFAGRIPFADQVEKIAEWYQLYRPQLIGIEDNAYQAVLAQQVARLDFMPPVIGQPAKGKKSQRILAMSPMFRIARVKIRKSHKDFINEWIAYDSTKSNPDDDCLDSVEIALRTAGILLPMPARKEEIFDFDTSVQGVIRRKIQNLGRETESFDEHLGGAW